MDSLVSVIVPTYNYDKFLPMAVSSVIDQTYKNIEIIIVDDCSNDNTAQVVKTFSSNMYNNIRYIRHAKNRGPSATRNTGIDRAKGEYIAFLDADDRWYPKKLEFQLKEFSKNHSLGLVSTGFSLIDVNKNIEREYFVNTFETQQELMHNLLIKNVVCTSSVLAKKICFEKVGNFDESLQACEDWDMWLRIAPYFEIGFVEEPLLVIYEHQENVSRGIEKMTNYRFIVMKKNISLFSGRLPSLSLTKKMAVSHIYLDAARGYNNLNINRKRLIYSLIRSIWAFPLKCNKKDDKYLLLLKQLLPAKIQLLIKKALFVN